MLVISQIDNVTGEEVGYAIEKLTEEGVKNVHVIPSLTKKNRPAFIFLIDIEAKEHLQKVEKILLSELGSLGYNIVNTTHVRCETKLKKVKVKLKTPSGTYDFKLGIKIAKYPSGEVISKFVEHSSLLKLQDKIAQVSAERIPLRVLKKIIEYKVSTGEKEIKIESK